jgi:hypothetical protein
MSFSDSVRSLVKKLSSGSTADVESASKALAFGEGVADQEAVDDFMRISRLDGGTRRMLAARMELDSPRLAERFAFVAAEAFKVYAREGKEKGVIVALRRAVDTLAKADPLAAVEMVRTLCQSLDVPELPAEAQAFRSALAGGLVSRGLMTAVWKGVASLSDGDERKVAFLDGLEMILENIDATHFSLVVVAMIGIEEGPVFDLLLSYVKRVASGKELEIGAVLPTAELSQAMALIAILAALETPGAQEAIAEAVKNPHPVVRIEALGHLEGVSSERLRVELRSLLQDNDLEVRLAALEAMQEHRVMVAGPFLAMRIRSSVFAKLSATEKRQAFSTLATLTTSRTEAICLEILADARLVTSSEHEETREIAAEILGQFGSSSQVVDVLSDLSKRRWKNTERVRNAARDALRRIELRLAAPGSTSGGEA